jgi:hypothetical protein
LLSFDRERETRARIGCLTNQPRTFGIATRLSFCTLVRRCWISPSLRSASQTLSHAR